MSWVVGVLCLVLTCGCHTQHCLSAYQQPASTKLSYQLFPTTASLINIVFHHPSLLNSLLRNVLISSSTLGSTVPRLTSSLYYTSYICSDCRSRCKVVFRVPVSLFCLEMFVLKEDKWKHTKTCTRVCVWVAGCFIWKLDLEKFLEIKVLMFVTKRNYS